MRSIPGKLQRLACLLIAALVGCGGEGPPAPEKTRKVTKPSSKKNTKPVSKPVEKSDPVAVKDPTPPAAAPQEAPSKEPTAADPSPAPAQVEEPAVPTGVFKPVRILAGISSYAAVMEDLEFIVVGLAGEKTQWAKNVKPNLDLLVEGLDTTKPIWIDPILDADSGKRKQYVLPVKSLKAFLNDNLDPVGISNRSKTKGVFYHLSGVFDGFLRVVNNYAVISEKEAEVPADMPDPMLIHKPLAALGYDLAGQLQNDPADAASRIAAFKKFRENIQAGLKKRTKETSDGFALRKKSVSNRMDILERLFLDSSEVLIGWNTTKSGGTGHGDLKLAAAEKTKLADYVQTVGATPSVFSPIPSEADAVATIRVNFPLDKMLQTNMLEIYKLSRAVTQENIESSEKGTPEEKEARKVVAQYVQDMLSGAVGLGVVDLFAEIVTTTNGHHNILVGVRCNAPNAVKKIVEKLPAAKTGWTSQLDADKMGDVAIHTCQTTPGKALSDFYDPSGVIYVGTGKETLWIAAGDGALARLKAAVKQVAGGARQASPDCLTVHAHLLPLLQATHSSLKEEGLDLMRFLTDKGIVDDQPKVKKDGKVKVQRGKKSEKTPLEILQGMNWEDDAIAALAGMNDSLDCHLRNTEGTITGQFDVKDGVLKAVGRLIGRFAKENLQ